jgi:hypothetical protein
MLSGNTGYGFFSLLIMLGHRVSVYIPVETGRKEPIMAKEIIEVVNNLNSAKEFDSDFSAVASWLHKQGWRFKFASGRLTKSHNYKEAAVFEDGAYRIVIFGTDGKYDSHLVLELDKLEAQGL